MIKKYISLLLVFSFLVFGMACKKTGEQNAETKISQKEAESGKHSRAGTEDSGGAARR